MEKICSKIATGMVIIAVLLAFSGCAGNEANPFIGEWEAKICTAEDLNAILDKKYEHTEIGEAGGAFDLKDFELTVTLKFTRDGGFETEASEEFLQAFKEQFAQWYANASAKVREDFRNEQLGKIEEAIREAAEEAGMSLESFLEGITLEEAKMQMEETLKEEWKKEDETSANKEAEYTMAEFDQLKASGVYAADSGKLYLANNQADLAKEIEAGKNTSHSFEEDGTLILYDSFYAVEVQVDYEEAFFVLRPMQKKLSTLRFKKAEK